ncbi:MAG: glycosyltransferase 87 family protein [Candidatus Hodarchaeota archaeon]
MNDEKEYVKPEDLKEKEYPIHLYFILILIGITIIFMVLRVLLLFYVINPYIKRNKDIDYIILIEGMKNGLINFYDEVEISDWPPYYLYFWYFLFFPMYLIPIEIGLYIWDLLRLISAVYIFFKAKDIFKSTKDLILFYILCSIGYGYDAFFNNVNFIITFFLFLSYQSLENDKKWIAGICFTLATFKINAILFIPLLLIVKKLKLKDIKYFIIPFSLICIPYVVFPNYFMQMINNWLYSDDGIQGILIIDSITWKALQPSHLMFISLLILIFLENLENISLERRKSLFRILIPSLLLIYYVYLTIIVYFIGNVSA